MSLLRRVDRAQRGADTEDAAAVSPQPGLTKAQVAKREDLLHDIRLRLQQEVGSTSTALLDAEASEVPARIEGIVDRIIRANGFAVTGDERRSLIEEMLG